MSRSQEKKFSFLTNYYNDGNKDIINQYDLICSTVDVHVHCKFWHISSPSAQKQHLEMTKFKVFWEGLNGVVAFSVNG